MRSAILVILSAILLAGLFVGYWVMQPQTPASAKVAMSGPVPPAPRKPDPAVNTGIRAGEHAWLRQYDTKGQLSSMFKGDQYHPRPNGTIDVENPVATFYLANHQRVEVHGVRGNVVMKQIPDPGKSGFVGGGSMSPPSSGRLEDVTVQLIDENRPPGQQVALTMKTNNTVFDNETFNIFTQGYRDDQGRDIPGDQVPVLVTGDIRMKGRGLKVRWNDADGRLELLEIAHGEVLIVEQNAMAGGAKKPKSRPPTALLWPAPPLPFMLAADDKNAAGEVLTSFRPIATQPKSRDARSSSASAGPVTYRASFFDNVRINQLDPSGSFDQLLIDNVDRMDVDFILKQSSEPNTAAPATAPAAAGGSTTAPAPASAGSQEQSANKHTEQTTSNAAPTSPAEPKENAQPVYIRWTGMLRIRPLQSAPFVPVKPGESVAKLVGSPVQVHRVEARQQGSQDIRSASVLYATAGERVWLDCSPAFPQVLIDKMPDPTVPDQRITHLVSMGQVQYSGAGHLARMTGPGNADIPLESEPGSPPSLLHAAWSRLAEFDFSAVDAQGQPVVRAGHFQGDVDIEHPRLKLRSQNLDLQFATSIKPPDPALKQQHPQSQTNLESVIAAIGVDCELMDGNGKKQTIEANRLLLETAMANARLYPRHVHATGSVHAYADDDLKSDVLDVLLRPLPPAPHAPRAPKQSATDSQTAQTAQVDLEEMLATGHVIARSKDASIAMGDRLDVTGGSGKTHAILDSLVSSKVIDAKGNFVTGPHIEFDTGDGRAYIVGPGMMYATRQESTTQPAEPMRVHWTTGAQFDGAANRIDADGSITAESTDRRGYVQTAIGDHIRIDLRPKPPTTQPILAAAHQSKSTPPKSDSLTSGVKMDLFKDKEVVGMTLSGNADMKSTLSAPNGMILQQMVLDGPRIIVQELAPDGTKARTVTVPAAGKMLVRDYRSAAAPNAAPPGAAGEPQGQGSTVFTWQKSMVYNDPAHRADMDGKVVIVHFDQDNGKGDSVAYVQMNAEHVTAWFEPAPEKKPAAGPAIKTANAKAPEPEDSHIQLKYLTALAGETEFVIVSHGPEEMRAKQIDYDPQRRVLIATGSERNPVYFLNNGTMQMRATRIDWNTVTWDPKTQNAIVDVMPVQPGIQPPKPKPNALPLRPGDRSNR